MWIVSSLRQGAVRASPSGRDGMGTAAAGSGEGFGGRSGGGGDSISRLEQQRETMRGGRGG